MNRTFKSFIAAIMAVLMVFSSMPLISIAAPSASITISSNTTVNGIDGDIDAAFTYEITIDGALYNGSAEGSDGNEYNIVNGRVTVPYNVSIIISNISSGSEYTVQRLAYDNSKYAYIDESERVSGNISTVDYYVSVNGGEKNKITAAEFNNATDNGENLSYYAYRDSYGNDYDEFTSVNAYEYNMDSKENVSVNYSSFFCDESAVEYYGIKVSDISFSTSSQKLGFITYYGYSYRFTVSSDDYDIEPVTVNVTENPAVTILSESSAKTKCVDSVNNSLSSAVYELLRSMVKETKKIAAANDYLQIPSYDNSADLSTTALVFAPITNNLYEYSTEDVDADKNIAFDAVLMPAPTGTFVIDFMLADSAVPEAYNEATFEIKNSEGITLEEGVDYNLEVKDTSFSILTYDIGFTKYIFSDIKGGDYTITQKSTKAGFAVDTTSYHFNVDKKTGEVTGDSFAKSDFDSSYTALSNNTYNLIKTFKVFKNSSFAIKFTKVDQNEDIVEGAQFVMIESEALMDMLKTLAANGITSIGDVNISDIIKQITSGGEGSLDVGTILGLILSIVNLSPELLENLTVPAILMATSDENGIVTFDNSSNILNIIDTITSTGVSGEELTSVLEKYFSGVIPEEYLPYLETFVNIAGDLNINTGMPSGSYLLLEAQAPYGYERNINLYSIVVKEDGTAVAVLGFLTPDIIDKILGDFSSIIGGIVGDIFDRIGDTVNEDWHYYNYKCFGKLSVDITDCNGNAIDDIAFTVKNSDGDVVEIVNCGDAAEVPYGEYTIELNVPSGYVALDEEAATTVTVESLIMPYSFAFQYHIADTEFKEYVAPGCVENGLDAIYCTSCNEVLETREVEALGHSFTDYISNDDATCTQDGTKTAKCDRCDATDTIPDVGSAAGHSFGAWETVVSPNCTDKGSEKRVCAECGYTESRDLDAAGHIWADDYTVDTEPDCTTQGSKSIHCTVCDAVKDSVIIDALGHDFSADKEGTLKTDGTNHYIYCGNGCGEYVTEKCSYALVSSKAPTCTEQGVDNYVCTVCGSTYETYTPATGHSFLIYHSNNDATCTQDGTKTAKCDRCDATDTIPDVGSATGHNFGAWETVVSPNCTDKGSEKRECMQCGYAESRELDAAGHIWADDYTVDAEPVCTSNGSKSIHCTVCDAVKDRTEIPAIGHKGGNANCHQGAICTECGAEYGDKDLNNHDGETEIRGAVAATVTEFGYTGDVHCVSCGNIIETGKQLDKLPPEIVEGMNSDWTAGDNKSLIFRSNAARSDFMYVMVDGEQLSDNSFNLSDNDTTVELTADYLSNLSIGVHTLSVVSSNGCAETQFTVTQAEIPVTDEPSSEKDETTVSKPAVAENKTETTKQQTNKNKSKTSPDTGADTMIYPIAVSTVAMFAVLAVIKKRKDDK